MPWNVPGGSGNGGSGNKDPWGQRRRPEQGPPDLDQIVKNLQQKLGALFGGFGGKKGGGTGGRFGIGKAGGFGAGLIAIVVISLWLVSGFYIVQQGERGVVLQFGKRSEVTEAGLRWHMPYPIETVEKVNVEKVHPVEIGYRSNRRTGTQTKVPQESLMLTEDENIIDIEFAVQYIVKDASDYLFNVRNPSATIKQATESSVREIVGRSNLDYVFKNRADISTQTQVLLQQILDGYKTGIYIRTVEMQSAAPPAEVKAAFDDAVKAREDKERFKNQAQAYANDIIPRARGAAARMVQESEGYKASVIARAQGDARRFTQIANEYIKAPAVTRDRLYIETMEQVLSNSTKIFIDQKAGNNILYLPLDKIISAPGTRTGPVQAPSPSEETDTTAPPEKSGSGRGRFDLRRRGVQ